MNRLPFMPRKLTCIAFHMPKTYRSRTIAYEHQQQDPFFMGIRRFAQQRSCCQHKGQDDRYRNTKIAGNDNCHSKRRRYIEKRPSYHCFSSITKMNCKRNFLLQDERDTAVRKPSGTAYNFHSGGTSHLSVMQRSHDAWRKRVQCTKQIAFRRQNSFFSDAQVIILL